LHCPPFLRLSIVCKQFDAHIQPAVAHFFEQALMQAFTSQLTANADGAKATERNTADKIAIERRLSMDDSSKNGISNNNCASQLI
jgi:hypothetical protein